MNTYPPGFQDLTSFSLVDALLGRRSRRFFRGAEIPDGFFAYKSQYEPMPLSELETLLVVAACGSNTSWHHMIKRGEVYAPYLSNYAAEASGRTFPSAAGFFTSSTFFTNDDGVYMLDVKDAPALAKRRDDGSLSLEELLTSLKPRITKLQEGRLDLPAETPYMEAHNTWVFNHPGTLVIIPVGDLAQHVLLALLYLLQNGIVLTDDINKRSIPGIEKFSDLVDVNNTWPLSWVETWSLSELTAELSISCYACLLMLQAIGLGGWELNGADIFSVLGASGDENIKGLGFRYDTNDNWTNPNPTGLKGVMEGYCPPHHPDMRSAVEALCERKFGKGGPYNPDTPGHWKDSSKVRSAAQVHSEEFKECVALQAQYIFDTYGKFPGTVPSIFLNTYLQAHHLDLEFYDKFYEPGAYLQSHSSHMKRWHPE